MVDPCSEDRPKLARKRHIYLCARRGAHEELSRDKSSLSRKGPVEVFFCASQSGHQNAVCLRGNVRLFRARGSSRAPIASLIRADRARLGPVRWTARAGGTRLSQNARNKAGSGGIFVLGDLPRRRAAAGVVSSALRAPSPRGRRISRRQCFFLESLAPRPLPPGGWPKGG